MGAKKSKQPPSQCCQYIVCNCPPPHAKIYDYKYDFLPSDNASSDEKSSECKTTNQSPVNPHRDMPIQRRHSQHKTLYEEYNELREEARRKLDMAYDYKQLPTSSRQRRESISSISSIESF